MKDKIDSEFIEVLNKETTTIEMRVSLLRKIVQRECKKRTEEIFKDIENLDHKQNLWVMMLDTDKYKKLKKKYGVVE